MKKVFLMLAVLMSLPAFAQSFSYEHGGQTLTYSVADGVASVTGFDGDEISGDLIIPETVVYEEQQYQVTQIGWDAFYGCEKLTSVSFPASLASIGTYAFSGCTGLEAIVIPNSVTELGESVFEGCSGLTSISLPNTLTVIPNSAFSNCAGLTSITFPETLQVIEGSAFINCTSLTSITFPESIITIDEYAFSGCTGLTEINFPEKDIKMWNSVFKDCIGLTSIKFPDALKEVPYFGFSGCTGLTSITFPENLEVIEENAFYGCTGLTSITIPAKVKRIKKEAFYKCSNLADVTCLATVPPSFEHDYLDADYSDIFGSSVRNLFVPEGAVDAYKASAWAEYFKTIEEIGEPLVVEISGAGKVYNSSFEEIESGAKIYGSTPSFIILADDENYISSITFDGAELLADLSNHRLTVTRENPQVEGTLKIEFAPDAEASLTVQGADNHSVTHTYKEGSTAKVALSALTGWKIHSVTYNNEDVTDKLDNNTFVTEPLHGNNNLNFVVVKDSTTDIEDVDTTDPVKVNVYKDKVVISGLTTEDVVSVYDLGGKTIYSGFDREIKLPSGNIYILTASGKSYKIAL